MPDITVTRQGNEIVVVEVGQSPKKFATETELVDYLASLPLTNTHPGGQPNPMAQGRSQADRNVKAEDNPLPEPANTTPEAKGKPKNDTSPTTNLKHNGPKKS